MDPITLSALVGGGASLLSTGASIFGQNQQQQYQQQQLALAQQNYMLQQRAMEEQQRMARAGREDALGNKVYFDGVNWVTETTPATKGVLLASQANERNQQVEGGIRSAIGQRNNFIARGNAGNLADAVLREYQNRVGAPTLEGTRGRDIVAAATKSGATRDVLADAVARNIIRGGSSPQVGKAAYDTIDNAAAPNLRTSMAQVEAEAPDKVINEKQAYDTANLNKYAPLQAIRSNINDTAVSPTAIGAPIDAAGNQAATYGAATSGRNAGAVDSAGATRAGIGYSPINYGGGVGALSQNIQAYLKSLNGKQSTNDPNWATSAANDAAYNNWQF